MELLDILGNLSKHEDFTIIQINILISLPILLHIGAMPFRIPDV